MITYSKIKSFFIEKGLRIQKVTQYGAKTAKNASDFGDDSQALKDTIAIYADTAESGESIIIGYLNKNQIAQLGEKRIFSLKEDGTLATSIHLKNDGVIEIGGNSDNVVRFIPLDTALQAQTNKINAEFTKIASALNAIVPASYIVAPVTINITGAKSDKIKII